MLLLPIGYAAQHVLSSSGQDPSQIHNLVLSDWQGLGGDVKDDGWSPQQQRGLLMRLSLARS